MSFPQWEMDRLNPGPEFLYACRDYFLNTPDYQSCIWCFPNERESEVLVGNQEFRVDDAPWWITIIDQYEGSQPLLINRDVFLGGQICFTIIPTLFLDSQIVNALHKYVTSRNTMEPSVRETVRRFIAFVKSHNFDLSPTFYYVEATAKSDIEKRDQYAIKRIETILMLQIMDMHRFLETGEIVSDPSKQKEQLKYYNMGSFDELVSTYVKSMPEELMKMTSLGIRFVYACLLKIAIVQRRVHGDLRVKYRVVREFMEDTLGAVLGNELTVALAYFAAPQDYQRFIRPLQPGMNFTTFCHNLRASAWDLLLARLPWQFLGASQSGSGVITRSCRLGYVCTADNMLRNIVGSQRIEMVFQEPGNVRPIVACDTETLWKALGGDTFRDMLIEIYRWQADRLDNSMAGRHISSDALTDVINTLEMEAATICK